MQRTPTNLCSFSPARQNILNMSDKDCYTDNLESFLIDYLKQVICRFGLHYCN